MTGSTPTRSYEQRMTALKRANTIRSYRAQVKRDVKAGRRFVLDLMDDPLCETMKVGDAMITLPKIGKVKRNKILNRLSISPNRSLGRLTERQRLALESELPGR